MNRHHTGMIVFVSIHVPARGTTSAVSQCFCGDSVSIHVPARGTTMLLPSTAVHLIVSIHVPARGTTNHLHTPDSPKQFQSTFPHGERQQSSTNFLCAFCSYLCNYTNKFRSTQPPARFSSHFTSKSRCESPWNSMFTPDSHHSVIALLFIRNHQNIHCTTS